MFMSLPLSWNAELPSHTVRAPHPQAGRRADLLLTGMRIGWSGLDLVLLVGLNWFGSWSSIAPRANRRWPLLVAIP